MRMLMPMQLEDWTTKRKKSTYMHAHLHNLQNVIWVKITYMKFDIADQKKISYIAIYKASKLTVPPGNFM